MQENNELLKAVLKRLDGGSKPQSKPGKSQQQGIKVSSVKQKKDKKAPISIFKDYSVGFEVKMSPRGKDAICIRGQDYLGAVIFPTTDVSGQNKVNYLINPLSGPFLSTRLEKYGQLYEKFCFSQLNFHYQPACSTTTAGSVILAYDRDVGDDTPPANDDGIRQYFSMAGARSANIWEPVTISCPLTDPQDFYYTSYVAGKGDLRLSHQGQFYLATMTPASVQCNGNLWISYEVHLFDPQLESTSSMVYADGGSTQIPQDTGSLVGQAWNNLNLATLGNELTIKGASGNIGKSIVAPTGQWLLEQIGTKPTNGALSFAPPALYKADTDVPASVGIDYKTTTLINQSAATTAETAVRRDAIEVLNPKGLRILGVNTGALATAAAVYLRLMDGFSGIK